MVKAKKIYTHPKKKKIKLSHNIYLFIFRFSIGYIANFENEYCVYPRYWLIVLDNFDKYLKRFKLKSKTNQITMST